MAELWFVGAGLGDEQDLSVRAREVLKGAGAVFAEEYTSRLAAGALDRLAAEIGRPIVRLDRAGLEGEAPIRAALASHARVVLLTAGDPFVATTHVALRVAAERWGHRWRYLPNATVLTAAPSFLGLMHYRFGRTVSLPFPEPGFAPRSPLESIRANRAERLHSLVLLDLRPAEGRFLSAHDGLRILTERDDGVPRVLPEELRIAVVARLGSGEEAAWYGTRAELGRVEFGPPLHAIVVPAPELHFQEAEAIDRFRVGAPAPPT